MFNKVLKVIGVPVALSVFLIGCSDSDQPVATVNGEEILDSALISELKQIHGPEVLDTLIANKIVELEAKALKIKLTQDEIDTEYESYTEAYGDEDALLEALSSYDMKKEDIIEDIKSYLLTVKVMEDYIGLTDEDVKAYFEENKESYGTTAEVQVSQILVEEEATAQDLLSKLNAGEDFATLAKENSIDSSSKDGGSIGYVAQGEKPEAYEQAAFAAAVGSVVGPIQTEDGYYIIKVTDKTDGEEADFEKLKDVVYNDLLNSRVEQEYSIWLDGKYEEYEIKTTLFE